MSCGCNNNCNNWCNNCCNKCCCQNTSLKQAYGAGFRDGRMYCYDENCANTQETSNTSCACSNCQTSNCTSCNY